MDLTYVSLISLKKILMVIRYDKRVTISNCQILFNTQCCNDTFGGKLVDVEVQLIRCVQGKPGPPSISNIIVQVCSFIV